MSKTTIVKCKCPNEFQDKQYGEQNRVANATKKTDGVRTEVRCTVCKTIHTVNNGQLRK